MSSSDPAFPRTATPLVAALANNELVSLPASPRQSCLPPAPVELASRTGLTVYRRSLCFLLSLAARLQFPGRRLVIGHSLGHGYLYWFDDADEVPEADVAALHERMRGLVAANRPVECARLAWAEAVAYFEENGQPDTALLLRNRGEPVVRVNACAGAIDLDHGPLVPSTGVLTAFALMLFPPVLLRYPPVKTPLRLAPFVDNPVLFSIYREYKNWGKILRLGSVGEASTARGHQGRGRPASSSRSPRPCTRRRSPRSPTRSAPEATRCGGPDRRPLLLRQDDLRQAARHPAAREGSAP